MGLFSKKPIQSSSTAPLYTIGGQKTVLLVGLGNPGKGYDGTRHNIGFACVDSFVALNTEFGGWVTKKDLKCQLASAVMASTRVICIKPTTFMNLSGEAVQAVQSFYKIGAKQIAVLHDELDIEFGQIRVRMGGGSAGHNGLKSVIQHTGADFGRVRIGINNDQRTKNDEKDFVLKPFNKTEQEQLKNLDREIVGILTEFVVSGAFFPETRNFLT